jgi:hypothetical protein
MTQNDSVAYWEYGACANLDRGNPERLVDMNNVHSGVPGHQRDVP